MLSWASKGQCVDVETCLQASLVLSSHSSAVPDPWENPANSKAAFMATEDTCMDGTAGFSLLNVSFTLKRIQIISLSFCFVLLFGKNGGEKFSIRK